MPLSPGDKLGHYEVLAPIGAGGMGEVYRARDTQLEREVAIKVLPHALASDPDRLARFDREAKILAALNHHNIAVIYGLVESAGQRALVMELVAGETLGDRIKRGPLPLGEALQVARQIAEALEAAHEKNIVHRDLKPGNVMITPTGLVKVLDFGLAAMAQPGPSAAGDRSNSPTLTMGMTQAGVIMGTAAYMAPEQAAGTPVDRRADIWSYGVVLWEMLSGRRLFSGDTVAHTLADVLRAPFDFDKLTAPRPIKDLLRRCLDRDVKSRLQAIGEARVAIQKWLADPKEEERGLKSPLQAEARSTSKFAWAVVAGLAVIVAGLSMIHFREKAPDAMLMRFEIPAPDKVALGDSLSVSPDGRRLAFIGRGTNGQNRIWVRSLETLEAQALPGTDGASASTFWSPDSRSIGFMIPGKLKKVEASGGPAQTLCDLPAGTFRGGAWAPDGTIVFGMSGRSLMRVPDSGGAPAPLTVLDPARQETGGHGHPSFLPDGRHFVYERASLSSESGGIYLGSLDAKPELQDTRRLVDSLSPRYAPSPNPGFGYVLFVREGSLMALPFDARRLQPAGAAVPIAEGIMAAGPPSFSASATGVLAFRTGPSTTNSQLLWFDRQGKQLGQAGPAAPYVNIQLSPNGKLLVVDHQVNLTSDHLWAGDPARGVFSRVNPGDIQDYAGSAVSPDGRVAFTYGIGGALGDIYVRLASGAGVAEPLVKSATLKHANHWSLDGRFLIYDDHTVQKEDLWIVPMSGDTTGEHTPIPFLVTPADETFGQFSPDTKWIAYSSDESGRREVYVQGFVPDHVPAAGIGKWQISTAGGDKPRWRRDGKELYYIARDGLLMAVAVKSTATTFEPRVAVPLFETHTRGFAPYDVAPDGRFLVNTVMEEAAANTSPITLVLNWTVGLKK